MGVAFDTDRTCQAVFVRKSQSGSPIPLCRTMSPLEALHAIGTCLLWFHCLIFASLAGIAVRQLAVLYVQTSGCFYLGTGPEALTFRTAFERNIGALKIN